MCRQAVSKQQHIRKGGEENFLFFGVLLTSFMFHNSDSLTSRRANLSEHKDLARIGTEERIRNNIKVA